MEPKSHIQIYVVAVHEYANRADVLFAYSCTATYVSDNMQTWSYIQIHVSDNISNMEPYPDPCLLVRDNTFKVTNMQTWSYIHTLVSDNMWTQSHIQIHVSDNIQIHGAISISM